MGWWSCGGLTCPIRSACITTSLTFTRCDSQEILRMWSPQGKTVRSRFGRLQRQNCTKYPMFYLVNQVQLSSHQHLSWLLGEVPGNCGDWWDDHSHRSHRRIDHQLIPYQGAAAEARRERIRQEAQNDDDPRPGLLRRWALIYLRIEQVHLHLLDGQVVNEDSQEHFCTSWRCC